MMLRPAAVGPPIVLPVLLGQSDAVQSVFDRGLTGIVGANEITFDDIAGRDRPVDLDAVAGVARDDVAVPATVPPIVLAAAVTTIPSAIGWLPAAVPAADVPM